MSAITTHIIDTTTGLPGVGIPVSLGTRSHSAGWQTIATAISDADGRVNDLLSASELLSAGHYRLVFEIGPYYLLQSIDCFFPQISINFVVKDTREHFHVPIFLSPFGYSTFRSR
ncbi:MAG: hydroxyisourate hydrolase [Pyrinomonadaceae bacterium]